MAALYGQGSGGHSMAAVETQQMLNGLLDELESKARSNHPSKARDDDWVCQRRDPRHPFRTDCALRFFEKEGRILSGTTGRTRNLSRNGLGLLTRRPFSTGENVEVELGIPGRGSMFILGVVTFCRYAGQSYYEVGMSLKGVKPHAILPRPQGSRQEESAA